MSGETIEFNVDQEYPLVLDGKQITLTVTEIDYPNRDIVFTVSGDGVKNPDEPRRMNISALADWMLAVKAKGK